MFKHVREEVIASTVRAYLKAEPDSSSIVGLYVWDEMVARGKVVNPREMAKYYPDRKEKVYSLVRQRLGGEPFRDAYAVQFYNEHSDQLYAGRPANFPFAQIELVHCYPNDIHVADVTLLDLTKPVEDHSVPAPRSHMGLHVFPRFLEKLIDVARDRKAKQISLVAASPAAAAVFGRYGFAPSTAPASDFAAKYAGFGHAMLLPVKRDN